MPSRLLSPDDVWMQSLRHFASQGVNREIITYLAEVVNGILSTSCTVVKQQPLPPLEEFITHLVNASNVGIIPLLTTLVYLQRLKSILPPNSCGLRSTPHRIFLASLILAVKYLSDYRQRNKQWAKRSRMKITTHMKITSASIGFGLHDVNKMEMQLIVLLGWDLGIREGDLCEELKRFLASPREQPSQEMVRKRQKKVRRLRKQEEGHIRNDAGNGRSASRRATKVSEHDPTLSRYMHTLQGLLPPLSAHQRSMTTRPRKSYAQATRKGGNSALHDTTVLSSWPRAEAKPC